MKIITALCVALSLVRAAVINHNNPTTSSVQSRDEPAVIFNPSLKFVRTPSTLSRRLTFTPAAKDEYCGEVTPLDTSESKRPLASDCAAISNAAKSAGSGYYTISPGDYSASGWVTVATAGTCAYVVKLKAESQGQVARVGTNDVRFQVDSMLAKAKGGEVEAGGSVRCFNGEKFVLADWKLVHSS